MQGLDSWLLRSVPTEQDDTSPCPVCGSTDVTIDVRRSRGGVGITWDCGSCGWHDDDAIVEES